MHCIVVEGYSRTGCYYASGSAILRGLANYVL